MEQGRGTGRLPGASPRERLASAFTRPPYAGIWALLAAALATFLLFVFLTRPEPLEQVAVVRPTPPPSPAPAVTRTPQAEEEKPEPEELPRVRVRAVLPPAGANTPAANTPASNAPAANGPAANQPAANAPAPARPGTEERSPARPTPPTRPVEEQPATPPVEVIPPTETGRPPLPAPVEPRPQPRPRAEPRRTPPVSEVRPATGELSIYFDADSSTFARGQRRLPLRVEVYVDGVRQLVTDDPEKREFIIGSIPAGRHEIAIVPYVGDAPADPRREIVRIPADSERRFKAVLRRSNGVSRVGKWQEQD
ncbi:MAG: hypothetical protein ACK47B_09740 [Armatimonadota bacterium]